MKSKQYISKGISIFLIVLLMQKAGIGLALHDWLHAQNKTCTSDTHPAINASVYNCTCVDDFYVPFSETPSQIVQTVPVIKTEFVTPPALPIPFSLKLFHSLRGPPSMTS